MPDSMEIGEVREVWESIIGSLIAILECLLMGTEGDERHPISSIFDESIRATS